MRRMLALITAMILVCSGCGGIPAKIDEPAPRVELVAAGDRVFWEGECLELQRRLVRWYGINLESDRPETNFRESYDNILAGPGGLMGTIHFPDARITLPIFHDGWEGEGFVHCADSPFPVGEGGTAVLILTENQPEFLKVWQSLNTDSVFQICILDQTLTYRITEELPGEDSCVLVISRAGDGLRLTGVLERK